MTVAECSLMSCVWAFFPGTVVGSRSMPWWIDLFFLRHRDYFVTWYLYCLSYFYWPQSCSNCLPQNHCWLHAERKKEKRKQKKKASWKSLTEACSLVWEITGATVTPVFKGLLFHGDWARVMMGNKITSVMFAHVCVYVCVHTCVCVCVWVCVFSAVVCEMLLLSHCFCYAFVHISQSHTNTNKWREKRMTGFVMFIGTRFVFAKCHSCIIITALVIACQKRVNILCEFCESVFLWKSNAIRSAELPAVPEWPYFLSRRVYIPLFFLSC